MKDPRWWRKCRECGQQLEADRGRAGQTCGDTCARRRKTRRQKERRVEAKPSLVLPQAYFGCVVLALALLPYLTGCAALTSRPRPVCVATGLASGIAAATGVIVGALVADCGPQCEQQKIRLGETIHDATLHHIEQRNAIIELGGPLAFVGFGFAGYAACMAVDFKG